MNTGVMEGGIKGCLASSLRYEYIFFMITKPLNAYLHPAGDSWTIR